MSMRALINVMVIWSMLWSCGQCFGPVANVMVIWSMLWSCVKCHGHKGADQCVGNANNGIGMWYMVWQCGQYYEYVNNYMVMGTMSWKCIYCDGHVVKWLLAVGHSHGHRKQKKPEQLSWSREDVLPGAES